MFQSPAGVCLQHRIIQRKGGGVVLGRLGAGAVVQGLKAQDEALRFPCGLQAASSSFPCLRAISIIVEESSSIH